MVTELQFVAVVAFLIWCLSARVDCHPGADKRAWSGEHAPAGWGGWRGCIPGCPRRIVGF
jgi:hypothetical protein